MLWRYIVLQKGKDAPLLNDTHADSILPSMRKVEEQQNSHLRLYTRTVWSNLHEWHADLWNSNCDTNTPY